MNLNRTPALALLLLFPALGPAGCGGEDPVAAKRMDREAFVQVMVDLREAERGLHLDSADAFAARRAEILDRHGATEDDLRAFVIRHHARVEYMAALWDTISERLRSLPPDAEAQRMAPSMGVRRHPDDLILDEPR